ncbi:MAG: tRNA preQ1(34) S-adenosylmethionine ribosyltransferase-isomerase QueA [Spartobacteria bacterium]|nr:tRNA preQ1(34) S-adenosylmethionine ribosyltransferase-isomerase QueA [Spartobacteria bacterium]
MTTWKTSDFDYALPRELIAQFPADRRDDARMCVVHRAARRWEHRCVRDLPGYLRGGDLLVLNNTKVIPARIFGHKEATGGRVELLLLEEMAPGRWDVLIKSGRRPVAGTRMVLGSGRATAEFLEERGQGRAHVRIHSEEPLLTILEEEGFPPLPPYISRAYNTPGGVPPGDRTRYQTIYAEKPGAVAAPTAGLHFTPELFGTLSELGVRRTTVTLHVGIGTFRPVSVEQVADHVMDEERYEVSDDTARMINRTKEDGGRVVAVGSTSVRTLESVAQRHGRMTADSGRTDVFIYPPYAFRVVDVMLTNFHLPRSTLLMMICALADRELIMAVYEDAVRERYRFFSYGDCMLIL